MDESNINPDEPPRGEVEVMLTGVWQEVLGVTRIGRHDNFFRLGGYSLLAMRAAARIRAQLQIDLSLRAFFDTPTIEGLSARIERGLYARSGVPPLIPQPRAGRIPVSYAQERMWLLDQTSEARSAYNVAVATRVLGRLDDRALEASLDELVRRHESLRTRFGVHDGVPHQLIDPAGPCELERVDLSITADPQQRELRLRELSERERGYSFDLARGRLLRAVLTKLDRDQHALLLTLHHIVVDGWSVAVLLREVSFLYERFTGGGQDALPALPVQYADYAIWERQWLQGAALQTHLRYWRECLASAPPELALPTDRARPPSATHRGASLRFDLPAVLCAALEGLARQEGATLFMVFLAAYQVLLARYTGTDDVIVGSPCAGRPHQQTEGLIGFFVNTLILRTDLSGNPTFRELVGRVKEVTLGAYAHRDLPFEKLVMELRPERNPGRHPIFQVMLALQNYPAERLHLSGLTCIPIAHEYTTAKFDLALHLFTAADALIGADGPARDSEGLCGVWEYAADLFDRMTIERMAANFRVLLESIVRDPECSVA
jgi:non-ribosomal peptide synthetase component F